MNPLRLNTDGPRRRGLATGALYVLATLALVLGIQDAGNPGQAMAAPQPPVTEFAIPYKTVGDKTLRLHVWTPAGWNENQTRPGIVFYHGGGWRTGWYKSFAGQAEYLASRGLVAISVQYRTEGPIKATADSIDAINYVFDHTSELGLSPTKVVVAGGSAGGQLALATLRTDLPGSTTGNTPAAVVLYNPVTDTTGVYPNGWGRHLFSSDDQALEYSPYQHITDATPPTLIMHGTGDTTVHFQNSARYVRRMREEGNQAALITYEGQPHAFFNRGRYYIETLRQTDRFLQSLGYLVGPQYIRSAPPQVVLNGNFTDGLTEWSAGPETYAAIALTPTVSLPKSVYSIGTQDSVTLRQDITSGLRANGQGEYYFGAHLIQADERDADITIRITIKDSTDSSWRTFDLPPESITGNLFSHVSGTRNLNWSGELESAWLEVSSDVVSGTYIDDAGAEFLGPLG